MSRHPAHKRISARGDAQSPALASCSEAALTWPSWRRRELVDALPGSAQRKSVLPGQQWKSSRRVLEQQRRSSERASPELRAAPREHVSDERSDDFAASGRGRALVRLAGSGLVGFSMRCRLRLRILRLQELWDQASVTEGRRRREPAQKQSRHCGDRWWRWRRRVIAEEGKERRNGSGTAEQGPAAARAVVRRAAGAHTRRRARRWAARLARAAAGRVVDRMDAWRRDAHVGSCGGRPICARSRTVAEQEANGDGTPGRVVTLGMRTPPLGPRGGCPLVIRGLY